MTSRQIEKTIEQPSGASSSERETLVLPAARRDANALTRLLRARRSIRTFADRDVDLQTLADLLWAAYGESNQQGYRTAPTARNWREIDIYVALRQGLFRYDAHAGGLIHVLRQDVRAASGQQDYVASAPINLIYVADFNRMAGASEREQELYAAADAGVVCQNVYLFCAAAGMATVARGLIDRSALGVRMMLRPAQHIILAQSVGYAAQ
jgi:nitroreductase